MRVISMKDMHSTQARAEHALVRKDRRFDVRCPVFLRFSAGQVTRN
jgi:hypothetical protein